MKLNNYYEDRRIVKYNGFFLSEHTSKLSKDATTTSKYNVGKEIMSLEKITEILDYAVLKNLTVSLQLNFTVGDGLGFPDDIVGKMIGYDISSVMIGEIFIPFHSIRHAKIIGTEKWYKWIDGKRKIENIISTNHS